MNVLFFLCSVFWASALGHEVLSEQSRASEAECLDLLVSEEFDVSSLTAKHVGFAMKKGFWKCAKELSHLANANGIDVRSVFDMESRTINREIKDIKSAIESSLPMSTIAPAFQWAQSPNEIFINVKFAHKLDAPATLNVEAESVSINDTALALKATDGRKNFRLNIDFLRKIDPNESTWSMASVGRMTLTLKKKDGPDNWPRLTKSKKKPNNIHFWWELHEKHARELEALDDDDDEKENVKDPVVKPPASGLDTSNADSGDDIDVASKGTDPSVADTIDDSEGVKTEEAVTAKKDKKKKKPKRVQKEKKPTLEDMIKEIEKSAKEKKKEIDRQAKREKEAVNKDTEEQIKELKRDFYKSKNKPNDINSEKSQESQDAQSSADSKAEIKADL